MRLAKETSEFDAHIHIALDGVNYKNAVEGGFSPDAVRARLKAYKDSNVLYLRDGGDNIGASAFAKKIAMEYGIEYRSPIFAIHRKGLYGGIVGYGFEDAAQLRGLIAQAKSEGCDFIKVMASGIMDFSEYGRLSAGRLSEKLIRSAVEIAHGEGLAIMVHANGDDAVRDCLIAGVDSIEHGYYLSTDTIKIFAQTGSIWVPTLAPVAGLIGKGRFSDEALKRILSGQSEAVRFAAEAGATIAPGSDAGAVGVLHPDGAFDERRLLESALGRFSGKLSEGAVALKERFTR